MQTFKREIATILTTLSGSPWARHPQVQEVLTEYGHLAEAARTPTATRRVSLQIFHASRAIDSLLAHIAEYEANKPGKVPATGYFTLGRSLAYIRSNTIGGSSFTTATDGDLRALTDERNRYLHRANLFPLDVDIRRFLLRTVLALQEASTFPP
jgi:hypothetical protein